MASLTVMDRSNALVSWFTENPLLIREVRRRMRGRLYSWSLIAYLGLLGLASLVIMYVKYADGLVLNSTRAQMQSVGEIGRTLYTGIRVLEFLIAVVVAPLLTAGIATAEKEKDTFDFLRVTTLSSRTFVVGCLMTTALFLMLIFSCTLPILGLTFIFGGVSMSEILTFNVGIFFVSMAICSWGIFNSTSYKRSRNVNGSIVLILLLMVFLGPGMMGFFFAFPGSPFAGVGWGNRSFQIFLGVLAGIVVILATAASRRLYDPNNRMYNYKQFTGFWLATLIGLAGWIVYEHRPWSSPVASAQTYGRSVIVFELVGFFLAAVAVALFSAGRIERGDEVWRLRLRRPFFRRIDERVFLYTGYIVIWMGTCAVLANADRSSFAGLTSPWAYLRSSFPLLLASWFVVLSAARLMSSLSENRNRAAAGTILLLLFFWGVVPILGFGAGQIGSLPGQPMSLLVVGVSDFMIDVSPFSTLTDESIGTDFGETILPTLIAVGLACLLVLPTAFGPLKRRLAIDYNWGEAREAIPEAGATAEATV